MKESLNEADTSCIICSVRICGFRSLQAPTNSHRKFWISKSEHTRARSHSSSSDEQNMNTIGVQVDTCIYLIQSTCSKFLWPFYSRLFKAMNCSTKSPLVWITIVHWITMRGRAFDYAAKLPVEWTVTARRFGLLIFIRKKKKGHHLRVFLLILPHSSATIACCDSCDIFDLNGILTRPILCQSRAIP